MKAGPLPIGLPSPFLPGAVTEQMGLGLEVVGELHSGSFSELVLLPRLESRPQLPFSISSESQGQDTILGNTLNVRKPTRYERDKACRAGLLCLAHR